MKSRTFAPPFHERSGFMPFILKTKIFESTFLGVWQITEPEEMLWPFVHLSPEDELRLGDIRHPLRRKQWLACRVIISDLTSDRNAQIRYTPKGRPVLEDGSFHISLSHSGEFAAAIVSAGCRTGIDIELQRDRILRVAERFMTASELGRSVEPDRLEKLYIHWSAKEALYKLYGGEQPDMQHGIILEPFEYLCSGSGVVVASVTSGKSGRKHTLHYMNGGGWMLVYTFDPIGTQ